MLVAALGLAGSRNLGFPPEPRLSGAGELGRRGEAVPYNGAGHWCKYADLRRAAAKHVDDADAALRAVLERFDLWDFYDQVGRQRAHVEAAPRPDGRPLTDAANKSGAPKYLQRKNVVVGLRWEVRAFPRPQNSSWLCAIDLNTLPGAACARSSHRSAGRTTRPSRTASPLASPHLGGNRAP